MARLIATALTSLDGYIADENGDIDWGAPDADVLAFINDMERPIGTYLYGRRLYETMVYWETGPTEPDQPQLVFDYARLWRAADGETDPEISSRLRGAAAILETVGRHVTTEIAAKAIVHVMDL